MRTVSSSSRHDPVSTPDVRRAFAEYPFSTLFSTGLGIGLFPWAPGTAGSALGAVASWLFAQSLSAPQEGSMAAAVGLLMSGLLLGLAAVPLTTRACRGLGAKDPGCVVLDEVAGQLLASAAVPLFRYPSGYIHACVWIASFLLFRLFDVWKPGPVGKLQDLPRGWGVVADDIAGGILAFGATAALAFLLSSGGG